MPQRSSTSGSWPSSRRVVWTVAASFCMALYFGWRLTYHAKAVTYGTKVDPAISRGPKQSSCRTARGFDSPYEEVHGYQGRRTPEYSQPIMGLETVLGDPSKCYMGHSRLGPYGYGEKDFVQESDETAIPRVDWTDVDWSSLQSECLQRNQRLYAPYTVTASRFVLPDKGAGETSKSNQSDNASSTSSVTRPRTAVIFRSWADYDFKGSILPYLRSLITELSLQSGGEYEIFLLVHIKDPSLEIFSAPDLYQTFLETAVPSELRGITLLWSEALLEAWYPKVPEHNVEQQIYQAVQLFSKLRPDFEYIWQFELDSRLIGDTRGALESIANWARAQPRKHLWERNAGFYITYVHGSYEDYSAFVEDEVDGIGVWGSATSSDIEPIGLAPPPHDHPNASRWGIGEEADLITLMPMVDTRGINWVFSDRIGNFMDGLFTARRAAPVAMTRCSKRLLHAIHDEQTRSGRWLPSEATPETFALLLGLKGVYAPHPMYLDGDWTPEKINELFNAGPASNLGGGKPSIYHSDWTHREIFKALTWWWPMPEHAHEHYPMKIWQAYVTGVCVPQMLLHPMKG